LAAAKEVEAMAELSNQLSSSFSGPASRLSADSTSDELIEALEIALRRVMERPTGISLPLVQAVRPALMALTRVRRADRFLIISDQICHDFRLGSDKLQSRSREQRIAFARQVAIFLCRKITGAPFEAIGAHFQRDHSTVIHAYRVIEQRARRDAAFRVFTEKLEGRITQTLSITAA
jgi:chromosomal replication initiator protein